MTETDLLPGKDVLVEVILDLLIGNVDTQLLKGILLKILKAKDIKYSNGEALIAGSTEKREIIIRVNILFFFMSILKD